MKNTVRMDQIADGSISECEAEIDGETESLILYREGETVRAWLNVCPHAGRRLDYAPGEFLRTPEGLLMCAVHGATFNVDDGLCVGGPCVGASLMTVRVAKTESGALDFCKMTTAS